jgi:NAD(P)-dependent dehydrogenase (short-subunit alcohol dehydrogenase family)
MSERTYLVTGATSGIGKQTALQLATLGATVIVVVRDGARGAAGRLAVRFVPGPATGAQTSVYLASSPGVAGVTGGYLVKCQAAEPSALARDAQAATRLWELSEELAGLA